MWGGDTEHGHEWGEILSINRQPGTSANSTLNNSPAKRNEIERPMLLRTSVCPCGAWLGSLGLEPQPELYIEHLVECFREVRRVLRDDGAVWMNLGDSYASSGKGPSNSLQSEASQIGNKNVGFNARWSNGAWAEGGKQDHQQPPRGAVVGYKPKDLMMMPFRVALALQADGWWVRSVIPWLKRNSMPESVTDRPATAVEYVFLLSKSARYYWDADAVRMPPVSEAQTLHNKRYAKVYDNHTAGAAANGQPGNVNNVGIHSRPGQPGRNRRNSDWFFESWQGLMLDEQDDPLVLVVNPAPFSASRLPHAYGGGNGRKVSPDCPIHGAPTAPVDDHAGDEPPSASGLGRNQHSDLHPDQSLDGEPLSTDIDQDANPADSHSASDRSSGANRTGSQLLQRDTDGAELASDIAYTESQSADSAIDAHTTASSSAQVGSGAHPLGQTPAHTAHISALEQVAATAGVSASGGCYSESNSTDGASHSDRATESQSRNAHKCSCQIIDHFAVFPPKLVEPMVKASTSEKGQCPECGAPWVRVVEKSANGRVHAAGDTGGIGLSHSRETQGLDAVNRAEWQSGVTYSTVGWRASCAHSEASPVPQTVLDPFGGAGTVGLVADRLGRNAVLCELSDSYGEMGTQRLVNDAPMFTRVDVA